MRRVLTLGLLAAGVTAVTATTGPLTEGNPGAVVASPQQQTLDVVLTNTGSRPKIGIPDFSTSGASAAVAEAAVTLADVLAFDLDFEREFYVIPRKTSASIPLAATPEALAVERWTALGAEAVLQGSLQETGGVLSVVVRLVPLRPGAKVWASSYDGCTAADARHCAHAIADDIHKTVRGVDGVARTRIAFTSDRGSSRMAVRATEKAGPGKEIYLMDYDGANPRPATANRTLNFHASWSPDARFLAYTTYARGFPDIYLVSLIEARAPTRPAAGDDKSQNFFPAISPDGTKIAFSSTRPDGGNMDIWVVNRDGTDLRNLTPNTRNSDEIVPTWSPGGNQIAFTSDRPGSPQLYVMNAADGLGLRRLTTTEPKVDRPRWAPAPFNFIAFVTGGDRIHDIAVIDLDTMQTRILTDGASANDSPTIAPNGRHIAFVTTRWGKEEIAIIGLDGKDVRRVTEIGNNTSPSWSPIPSRR
jgi:TolB protein